MVGAIEYRRRRGEPTTLAVLQSYVPNEGTAWSHAREELRRFFERVLTRHREDAPPGDCRARLLELAAHRAAGRRARGDRRLPGTAALLGRRTAEMHLALGADGGRPELRPRAVQRRSIARSKYQSMRNLGRQDAAPAARARWSDSPRRRAELARACSTGRSACSELFEPFLTRRLTGAAHPHARRLPPGQLLYTGKDFVIIDFEGLPGDTLAERRRKHICLRDVAGMIRSFHFAAASAAARRQRWCATRIARSPAPGPSLAPLVLGRVPARLPGTRPRARAFLPAPEDFTLMLGTQLVGRALIELGFELANPLAPTVVVPLAAIAELGGV